MVAAVGKKRDPAAAGVGRCRAGAQSAQSKRRARTRDRRGVVTPLVEGARCFARGAWSPRGVPLQSVINAGTRRRERRRRPTHPRHSSPRPHGLRRSRAGLDLSSERPARGRLAPPRPLTRFSLLATHSSRADRIRDRHRTSATGGTTGSGGQPSATGGAGGGAGATGRDGGTAGAGGTAGGGTGTPSSGGAGGRTGTGGTTHGDAAANGGAGGSSGGAGQSGGGAGGNDSASGGRPATGGASTASTSPRGETASGCSCRIGAPHSSVGLAPGLGLLLSLFARRRRTGSRGPASSHGREATRT